MDVRCTLEERISKKTNRPYKCLVLQLTDTYQKVVFLDDAELELIKMIY